MAQQIVPYPITLSDLQDHSGIAILFKCDSAAVEKISTDIVLHTVPLQSLSFLLSKLTIYLHSVSKRIPPTTNDNFNSSCPIPVIFGTNISEQICYQKVV